MTRYLHAALLCFALGYASMSYITKSSRHTAEKSFQFVVYGDMPYGVMLQDGRSDAQVQVLAEDIALEIRRREDLPFAIHLGDLGRPKDVCLDTKLEEINAFWATELRKSVFYTPGDNEWADCEELKLFPQISELERLGAV